MNILSAMLAGVLANGGFNPINPVLENIIGQFVGWIHSGVNSLGLTIIIFTLGLKLVTLPLDVWQKIMMKKNSAKTKKLQPLLEKIDKQYAGDYQRAAAEKRNVYKKHGQSGASMAGTCLSMLLTFGIFILMFQGLQAYATYGNQKAYDALIETYVSAYDAAFDDVLMNDGGYIALLAQKNERESHLVALEGLGGGLTDEINECRAEIAALTADMNACATALKNLKSVDDGCIAKAKTAVGLFYNETVEGFLWVKNIYRPDTWATFFPTYEEFTGGGAIGVGKVDSTLVSKESYNTIRDGILEVEKGYFDNGWNGLIVLPLLSIALSFLSMWITQRTQNVKDSYVDKTTAGSNKLMMFLMPAMMAYFAFIYTAAFALYVVCNSFISMIINIALNPFIDKYATKKVEEEEEDNTPSYSNRRK